MPPKRNMLPSGVQAFWNLEGARLQQYIDTIAVPDLEATQKANEAYTDHLQTAKTKIVDSKARDVHFNGLYAHRAWHLQTIDVMLKRCAAASERLIARIEETRAMQVMYELAQQSHFLHERTPTDPEPTAWLLEQDRHRQNLEHRMHTDPMLDSNDASLMYHKFMYDSYPAAFGEKLAKAQRDRTSLNGPRAFIDSWTNEPNYARASTREPRIEAAFAAAERVITDDMRSALTNAQLE